MNSETLNQVTHMKYPKIIAIVTAVLAASSMAFAGPPAGGWHKQKSLSSEADFAALEPGDQIAQVCKHCDTVSVHEIESKEEAMAYCEKSAVIDCPSCENIAKVVHTGPPNRGIRPVKFVDQHGKACMYMTKLERPAPKAVHGHKGH